MIGYSFIKQGLFLRLNMIGDRRFILFITLIIVSLSALTGCRGDSTKQSDSEFNIYYIDSNETKVVKVAYEPVNDVKEKLVQEYINVMKTDSGNIHYKKPIPDSITLKEYEIRDDGQLNLYFDADYSALPKTMEVLCRAAIVKTLCQVEGIEFIEFYVNSQPLMNTNEKPIGLMKADNFIDRAGSEALEQQSYTMTLFFANKRGNRLKETHLNVEILNGTIPMEQLIIEQLIKGPASIIDLDQEQFLPTVPSNTKLIKVMIKDGVCYVDLSAAFLERIEGITDEVAVYSVVNSLVELTSVNKVKFLIDGMEKKFYREGTAFDVFFERNLDIVENSD